jgi:hypothetical protein
MKTFFAFSTLLILKTNEAKAKVDKSVLVQIGLMAPKFTG